MKNIKTDQKLITRTAFILYLPFTLLVSIAIYLYINYGVYNIRSILMTGIVGLALFKQGRMMLFLADHFLTKLSPVRFKTEDEFIKEYGYGWMFHVECVFTPNMTRLLGRKISPIQGFLIYFEKVKPRWIPLHAKHCPLGDLSIAKISKQMLKIDFSFKEYPEKLAGFFFTTEACFPVDNIEHFVERYKKYKKSKAVFRFKTKLELEKQYGLTWREQMPHWNEMMNVYFGLPVSVLEATFLSYIDKDNKTYSIPYFNLFFNYILENKNMKYFAANHMKLYLELDKVNMLHKNHILLYFLSKKPFESDELIMKDPILSSSRKVNAKLIKDIFFEFNLTIITKEESVYTIEDLLNVKKKKVRDRIIKSLTGNYS